ncbi:hypothetical protein [Terribacillus saccharophilus]|uniref:hypothetical protein n=1 Tax=Terribacillus saccharophilus TaxID=361277 RepID=UPI000BA6FF3A|nr:hypothetical protein [Terribacillus saccharophilus]PAD94382.1 hypothetical protein CHH50_18860 [Terribacillus saccharophilus]
MQLKEDVIQDIKNYIVFGATSIDEALELLYGIAKGWPGVPRDLADPYADLNDQEKAEILTRISKELPAAGASND